VAARLKERYFSEIQKAMFADFKHSNIMEVPRLDKVVINMGVGEAMSEPRMMELAVSELTAIAGQKPAIRKAKKSISGFKLRAGSTNACMVTLRGDRMYEFIDRLFNIAIPRIRDFRGLSQKSFDKQGNYTLGLREQTIFPEINIDNVQRVRGMNVTFVFGNSASTDENRDLLRRFGMPFRN